MTVDCPALSAAVNAWLRQLRTDRQSRVQPRGQGRDALMMTRTARSSSCSRRCGLGVFLVGVELMVTAVALPQILELAERLDAAAPRVVDRQRLPGGLRRGHAARRPCRRSLQPRRRCTALSLARSRSARSWPARAQSLDWLIAARVVQGAGAGAIFPLATAARRPPLRGTSPRPRHRPGRRAVVPGHGLRPVRRCHDPPGLRRSRAAAAHAQLALGLLPGRAVRAARRASTRGPPRAAGRDPPASGSLDVVGRRPVHDAASPAA